MRKFVPIVLLLPALAGCALFRVRSESPDEFAVARNAPLVIPPDYALEPPAPGAAATAPTDAQQQAIEALFGGPAPRSTSEMLLLEKAGRDHAALGARSVAGDPETLVVDKGQTTAAILAAPQADGQVASVQLPQ